MLSNGFAGPLRLRRKPSRLLVIYLLSLHGLVLFALCRPLAMPYSVHAVLLLAWLASVIYHAYQFRRQCDPETQAWVWQAGGTWLRGSDSTIFTLVLRKTLQTPWFVILSFSTSNGKPAHLIILRDQIDADSFRRLRVRLKYAQDEAATSREEAV